MSRHRPFEQSEPFLIRAAVAGGPVLHGRWWHRGGVPFAAHLHHPYAELDAGLWPGCAGGGYVCWADPGDAGPLVSRFTLVAGGIGDVAHFELSPSLWHKSSRRVQADNSPDRGCHGYVRGGAWHVV